MKTQFHIQFIRISVIVLLTTVISLARDVHSTKVIKLKGYTDKYTVSLEYDSAIVSFSLRDVREWLTKLKANRDYQGRDFQSYFSETSNDISTDKNYLFKSYQDFVTGGGIIEQYVLRSLISKGKATVFDKRTNKYVNKIKKIHYRVSMAGEGHEGYEFAFMNGSIFLLDRISI